MFGFCIQRVSAEVNALCALCFKFPITPDTHACTYRHFPTLPTHFHTSIQFCFSLHFPLFKPHSSFSLSIFYESRNEHPSCTTNTGFVPKKRSINKQMAGQCDSVVTQHCIWSHCIYPLGAKQSINVCWTTHPQKWEAGF